jgi:ribosome-associated protein
MLNNILNLKMIKNEKLLNSVIEGIQEKRGKNIISMDFEGKESAICDYFVICDASSNRQVQAISDSVLEFAHKLSGEKPVHVEGTENLQWILIDFTDIVVHIFLTEWREFYNLEDLWADSKIVKHDIEYSSIK